MSQACTMTPNQAQEPTAAAPPTSRSDDGAWTDVLLVLGLLLALTLDLAMLAIGGLLLTSPTDSVTMLQSRLPWWGQAAVLLSLGFGASAPIALIYTLQRLHRRGGPVAPATSRPAPEPQ
jgi:hypothetical protein